MNFVKTGGQVCVAVEAVKESNNVFSAESAIPGDDKYCLALKISP